MTAPAKQPLSNIQLQLLQLFAQDVSEEDLKAIQRIVKYFAEKTTAAADDFVELLTGVRPIQKK